MILNVLWALGWSMVVLALLVHLPVRVLAPLSVAVIGLHNLLDGVSAQQFGAAAWVWNILHKPGVFLVAGAPVLSAYPLIPWFAVMAAGFCFGRTFKLEPEERRRRMLRLGLLATLAFLVLRWANAYGDPVPWSAQSEPAMTVLAFLRTAKYPPSLDFLLMTLGPSLLLLTYFESARGRARGPLLVFGRVPLFYFLVHLFLIHLLAVPLALFEYGEAGFLLNPLPSMGGDAGGYPPGYGYELPAIYLLWLLVLLPMYPLCRWFEGVKQRRRAWWIRYL